MYVQRNVNLMSKKLFIAEKPSVAKEFAKALKVSGNAGQGYLETGDFVVTWCVGHLVTMSYPDVYDAALKKWSLGTLPFLPEKFLYELIPDVKKQFNIVKGLLNRDDVSCIYVCTDSGREGEYIYRLVEQMAGVPKTKEKRRVWIDSQTEEEIIRGIREAKPLSEYDALSSSAYLRAKEDYLMGINFSRVLSLKYGKNVMDYLGNKKWSAISVGRVMTCVLGMVVRREREIREFVKTPFYRLLGNFVFEGKQIQGEWRAVSGSSYFKSPKLYKENGFLKREDAKELSYKLGFTSDFTGKAVKSDINVDSTCGTLNEFGYLLSDYPDSDKAVVQKIEKKTEKKNPPLLFNLAELQNTCSKLFKISPDETLKIVQELYERKLVTYPRTDARVLSTAVAKEIHKNIGGLRNYPLLSEYAAYILNEGSYKKISATRYVNDKQITDHYAIIPTGQGFGALNGVSVVSKRVYEVIARRFLCIFYPPAQYLKIALTVGRKMYDVSADGSFIRHDISGLKDNSSDNNTDNTTESFFASFKVLKQMGYLEIATSSFAKKNVGNDKNSEKNNSVNYKEKIDKEDNDSDNKEGEQETFDSELIGALQKLKKNSVISMTGTQIKEGETSPPKRYNSGSMILAMENAGQLIEDEDLRSQIKGSGIGTSATRAEILSKLVKIKYLKLNKKTQIITPELFGEMVYDVVNVSIRSLLNPELTASWELGLTQVADGKITEKEYMDKLEAFITRWVDNVKQTNFSVLLRQCFDGAAIYYKK